MYDYHCVHPAATGQELRLQTRVIVMFKETLQYGRRYRAIIITIIAIVTTVIIIITMTIIINITTVAIWAQVSEPLDASAVLAPPS